MISPSWTVPSASRLCGAVRVPGDKSISHRYVLLGGLARGTTTVIGLSPGADLVASVGCLRALGVRIGRGDDGALRIDGRGRAALARPVDPLDAANSGTTMRLLAGVLATCPFAATITGDPSLRRRPMARVIEPLVAMGARIGSADGRPPLTIAGGPLRGLRWTSPVASAQVKSAILLAGLAADGETRVTEPAATRDHTERAFPAFGLDVTVDGLTAAVRGGQEATAPGGPLTVPGDPSAAAVWAAAAAALPGSAVTIEDVCLNPRRLGFARVLARTGADVRIDVREVADGEPVGSLHVAYGAPVPAVIGPEDVPDLIDELPVLAAAAALGAGLEVSGAGELRVKESDRISALVGGLRTLGIDAEERPDGFRVPGSQRPHGGTVDAVGDHRLVMAFAIAGLGATDATTITGADVVGVSYPDFARDLARLLP